MPRAPPSPDCFSRTVAICCIQPLRSIPTGSFGVKCLCSLPALSFSSQADSDATPTPSFCKNHFGLQLFSNSLNSSGAVPEPAFLFRPETMNTLQITRRVGLACLFLLAPLSGSARVSKFTLPSETPAILDKIYSFDLDGAIEAAQRMEHEQPNHPLGFLMEAEAMWWRIWCTSADFKFGMSDARRRPKLGSDRRYMELSAKALSLAEAHIKQSESAEMQFYAV